MKKTITPPPINANDITEILAAIANGTFPSGGPEPEKPIEADETERCIILQPTAKHLFAAAAWVTDARKILGQEHDALHEAKKDEVDDAVCKKFAETSTSLANRATVLGKLMWTAIHDEQSATRNNSNSLRLGWKIVSDTDTPWNSKTVLFPEQDNLMNGLAQRILDIFAGKTLPTESIVIECEPEADQKVIGTLNDERVKSLRVLSRQLRDLMMKGFPHENGEPCEPGSPEFMKWFMEHNVGGLHQTVEVMQKIDHAIHMVDELFWICVRDTVPGADIHHIQLCKGWVVVEVPSNDDEDESGFDILEIALGIGGHPLDARIISGDSALGRLILKSALRSGA